MYHMIVRMKLRNVFAQLSKGNYEVVFSDLADPFEHTFLGDHTFGGTRRTQASFRRWFERLYTVFPDLSFNVKNILVKGWPWDTLAAVEWQDQASTLDGRGYVNEGVHMIRLRWVKVVSLRVYPDTQKLADACRRQAVAGVPQAMAPQITD
jgi:ketosteroid isomerase-like protein